MINRRHFLAGMGYVGLGLTFGCHGREDEPGEGDPATPVVPNIVFIYSDQHRGDALGCLDDPVVQTPSLDSLAAEGVNFRRCFTNSPLCRPARTSLMTGLFASEHGAWSAWGVADADSPSFVRRIRDEAGYRTAVIGKTHLHDESGHLDDARSVLDLWGFEESVELSGPSESTGLESAWTDFLGSERFERFVEYMENYWANHFDHDHWLTPAPDESPWELQTEDHLDVFCGQTAAQWIDEVPQDRPFFLQVSFPGPHNPFDATTEWRQDYDPDDPSIPTGAGTQPPEPASALFDAVLAPGGGPSTPEEVRALRALYYAKVSMIDAQIGEIVAALAARGMLDNTWIVYSSDHGEMLGDHGLVGKIVFHEGSISVPLIIRPPGGGVAWASDALSDTMDIRATLLDIAGLEPDSAAGRSLLDAVEGGPDSPEAQTGKGEVFSQVSADDTVRYTMIRTDEHKLVVADGAPSELYDLLGDPDENENRVDDPVLASQQAELLALVENQFGS